MIARDLCNTNLIKPSILYNSCLPSLDGSNKMSSSNPLSCIYLDDTNIKKKIQKAFSGG